jgi:hypothetical protein
LVGFLWIFILDLMVIFRYNALTNCIYAYILLLKEAY